MSDYHHLQVETRASILILRPTLEEITEYELAEELAREMVAAVPDGVGSNVIVDLVNLRTMTSVGYGPFISLRAHVTRNGGRLILCHLSPFIHDVFTATRLLINPRSQTSRFEHTETLSEAIAAIGGDLGG